MTRSVYFFGNGKADGTREMKAILGGKGANLAEMTNLGVPVPPGFTITTAVCVEYLEHGGIAGPLRADVAVALESLEATSGKRFGDATNPLLVSVRSGAAVSMPGMMETILNLGLNDDTVEGLAAASGNPRFAYDSYRRFLQMYADVVLGVPMHSFEQLLGAKRLTNGVTSDADLPADALRALVCEYQQLIRHATGADFPMDPRVQLWGAIEAVWRSWTLKKAVDYRRVNAIPHNLGTAVNIVSMVFGNMGDDSGTGVAFTRDPSTGERRFYGEFLVNAQGEDVVAGIRTPLHIDEMAQHLPTAYMQLMETQERLERHFRDMQDIEFTVERGTLYLLQTRTGKRTTAAALRIATDMVTEGLIEQRDAVMRLQPNQLDQLLHRVIGPSVRAEAIATGLPASPGAASGIAVFDPDAAEQRAEAGAGRLADPMIGLGYARLRMPMENRPIYEAMVEQPLPRWGERDASRALAVADSAMAAAGMQRDVGMLAGQIAMLLAELEGLHARISEGKYELKRIGALSDTISARVGQGSATVLDRLAIDSRSESLIIRIADWERQIADKSAAVSYTHLTLPTNREV